MGEHSASDAPAAVRALVRGRVQGVGFRDATVRRARSLGVLGWVRNREDGAVEVHAEGPPDGGRGARRVPAPGTAGAAVTEVDAPRVKVEGHEQFAVRGVSAGMFVVRERAAGHLRAALEVDGATRAWALPKGPSMDPAVKRFAVEVDDHDLAHNASRAPPTTAA